MTVLVDFGVLKTRYLLIERNPIILERKLFIVIRDGK